MIISFYSFIAKTDRLPYKNYFSFSTASRYIYSKVLYNDSMYLIVKPNNDFYHDMKSYLYHDNYNVYFYVAKISFSNFFDIPIKINKSFYDNNKFNIVDNKSIFKYKDVDITTKNYIKENAFQDSIKWKDKKALVYLFLKRKIRNCSNDCETGNIMILKQ